MLFLPLGIREWLLPIKSSIIDQSQMFPSQFQPSISSPSSPPPYPIPIAPPVPFISPFKAVLENSQNTRNSCQQSGGTVLNRTYTSLLQESRKACHSFFRFKGLPEEANNDYVFLSWYNPVQPVIQNGPICGLVALAMVTELIGDYRFKTEDILAEAKKRGYSKQGEIFSASWLQDLASYFVSCKVKCVYLGRGKMAHSQEDIDVVDQLLHGNLILIPYDADKNHGPCQKKGHKAHWALLTGFFIAFKFSDVNDGFLSPLENDSEIASLYYWPNDPDQGLYEQVGNLLKEKAGEVFVFGHHGKSKYTGFWHLDALLLSNDNLVEVGPERNLEDYVIPAGGIETGLRSQLVVFQQNLTR